MMHETDDLNCPRCGDSLFDAEEEEQDAETGKTNDDEMLRVELDCPSCGAPLAIIYESALPDALGLDIWVEDRREQ